MNISSLSNRKCVKPLALFVRPRMGLRGSWGATDNYSLATAVAREHGPLGEGAPPILLSVPADVSYVYEHARMANPHAATRILSWRSSHGTIHRKQLIVESVENDGI